MKRITGHKDKNTTPKNPLRLLLGSLPIEVYREKWGPIRLALAQADEYEHFRQSISREGFDLGRTHTRAMVILRDHLGLSQDFFTAEKEEQFEEVSRILESLTTPVN